MKCLCGYEYLEAIEEFIDGEFVETMPKIGDRSFYPVSSVTINLKQGEWDCDRLKIVQSYACPKCGVIKLEVENICS